MKFNCNVGGNWLVLLLILIACQAYAGEAETPARSAGVATFGQLDQLRSQNALLAEELKNAELKSKLKSGGMVSNGASALAFPGAGMNSPPVPLQTIPAAPAKAVKLAASVPALVLADVQMVSTERDNRLVALLSLENGRQVKVRVGSTILGVGTVQRISADEVVVVTAKGKAISLPFGSEPSNLPTNSSSPTPMPLMMGMPSLSTVMPPMPRGER